MSETTGEFGTYDESRDDGHAPLALAAGLAAGIVAGGLWALLVYVTRVEIGYAAWGVGLLVGLAMTTVTRARTRQLAFAAALFAVVGLFAAKAFIFAGGTGRLATALEEDAEVLKNAVAWQMYANRQLDPATLQALDETEAAGDTLSDALWHSMREQAGAHIERLSEAERHDVAVVAAKSAIANIGILGGVSSQLSGFDLLWLFLAVGTAYRMMAPTGREAVAESEPTNV